MNLLDHNNMREFRPRCGNIIPGTHSFETIAARWSPSRLQIYESEHLGQLMEWVNILFARDSLHVVAVSPAAVCALRESESVNNPLLTSHYTISVIYQDRLDPPPDPVLDDDGNVRSNADGTCSH